MLYGSSNAAEAFRGQSYIDAWPAGIDFATALPLEGVEFDNVRLPSTYAGGLPPWATLGTNPQGSHDGTNWFDLPPGSREWVHFVRCLETRIPVAESAEKRDVEQTTCANTGS